MRRRWVLESEFIVKTSGELVVVLLIVSLWAFMLATLIPVILQ